MSGKKSRLFRKYFTIISCIVIMSFLVLSVSVMGFTSQYWRHERVSMLEDIARQMAYSTENVIMETVDRQENIMDFDWRSDFNLFYLSNTMDLLSVPFDTDIFISDMNGRVRLCKHTVFQIQQQFECIHIKSQISQSDILKVVSGGVHGASDVLNDVVREKSYSVGVPVIVYNNVLGIVFATTPYSSVEPYVNDILQILLMSTAFALLIAVITAYILAYRMVTPLRQMAEATRKFSQGDFSERVYANSNDEMGELVNAFNAMALSLATLESTRRSFIANVSHELRTPMTTIGGFIDGILDGTIPPEKHDYYLNIVSEEIKRLSRLVIQMLNMAEIEAGKKKISPTVFDISKRIFQVFVSFEKRIDEKMIEVRGFEYMKSINVEADADMIHQCIYNLVDNAIKFTNEGGYIEVSAVEEQKRAVVRIKNSGEGLSPEEAHRVFERFYKVDKSRSKDVKGTGIGLYIVKTIIGLHGGDITVNSKEGEYCEFVFWIPMKCIDSNGKKNQKQNRETT